MREHGLKLKLKKCLFLQAETNYLGFIINGNGISLDPQKVEAREVRSFIGCVPIIVDSYRISQQIAEAVIALMRKHAHFCWTKQCRLKDKLRHRWTNKELINIGKQIGRNKVFPLKSI